MRNPNAWATREELSILASRVGLVDESDAGRASFAAWLGTDQQAARKALFGRVAAQRVAASATQARSISARVAAEAPAASTGGPTAYPAGWAKSRAIGATVVTARAAGDGRTRITQASD